jgi:RNA polymerase sigma-70 factor (ECF subfamily)
MEDQNIIELYWQRSEDAITETKQKYGPYCTKIAYNILASFEDTEECVADTYLKLWDAIPPARPTNLKAYLGRITHNLAINRYRANSGRKHSSLRDVLTELQISELEDPAEEAQRKALADAVSAFLFTLKPDARKVFVLRYWNYDEISVISQKVGLKEATINSMLYRTRKKLKNYLEKEDWEL